jgi:hypothetical protein
MPRKTVDAETLASRAPKYTVNVKVSRGFLEVKTELSNRLKPHLLEFNPTRTQFNLSSRQHGQEFDLIFDFPHNISVAILDGKQQRAEYNAGQFYAKFKIDKWGTLTEQRKEVISQMSKADVDKYIKKKKKKKLKPKTVDATAADDNTDAPAKQGKKRKKFTTSTEDLDIANNAAATLEAQAQSKMDKSKAKQAHDAAVAAKKAQKRNKQIKAEGLRQEEVRRKFNEERRERNKGAEVGAFRD